MRNTHFPQNPFKIELNKNKDEIILLNPLEIVKGLISDYDSLPPSARAVRLPHRGAQVHRQPREVGRIEKRKMHHVPGGGAVS